MERCRGQWVPHPPPGRDPLQRPVTFRRRQLPGRILTTVGLFLSGREDNESHRGDADACHWQIDRYVSAGPAVHRLRAPHSPARMQADDHRAFRERSAATEQLSSAQLGLSDGDPYGWRARHPRPIANRGARLPDPFRWPLVGNPLSKPRTRGAQRRETSVTLLMAFAWRDSSFDAFLQLEKVMHPGNRPNRTVTAAPRRGPALLVPCEQVAVA